MSKREKQIEDLWTERFTRRAAGRITRREARELGRRWRDTSTRLASDRLEGRTFAQDFASVKKYGPEAIVSFGQSCRDRFYFYGPSCAHWPGDVLVLVVGGWRTMCADGCPCGRCFRPSGVPITLAMVDMNRPQVDETHEEYVARLSGPGLARTKIGSDPLAATPVVA